MKKLADKIIKMLGGFTSGEFMEQKLTISISEMLADIQTKGGLEMDKEAQFIMNLIEGATLSIKVGEVKVNLTSKLGDVHFKSMGYELTTVVGDSIVKTVESIIGNINKKGE